MADIGDRLGPKDGSFDGGVAPLGPLLPPFRLRTAREEESLRQTHWKDLFASDQPSDPWWLRADALRSGGGVPFKHWSPSGGASNGDVQSLLRPPTVKPDGTVALSQDGASDEPNVAAGKGPRVVAQEAEKRPPNTTIETKPESGAAPEKEEESPWEVKAKGSHGSELQQRDVNYGGDSRRSPASAARRSLQESSRSFDRKYMRDAEASVGYERKASGELRKIEDTTGFGQGSMRAFYGDAKAGATASASRTGAKLEGGGSAEAGLLKAKGELNKDGVAGVKAEGRAVSAEAEARLKAEIKFKEREAAITGRLGASAVLLDGEIGGEVRVTPRRVWNGVVVNGVNTAASWFGYGEQLKRIDSLPDWGIVLGVGVGGTVGAAAEIEGNAYSNKKGLGAGGKVKVAPGIGGSVRANAGILWGN